MESFVMLVLVLGAGIVMLGFKYILTCDQGYCDNCGMTKGWCECPEFVPQGV